MWCEDCGMRQTESCQLPGQLRNEDLLTCRQVEPVVYFRTFLDFGALVIGKRKSKSVWVPRYSTWFAVGSNTGQRCEKSATNRISNGFKVTNYLNYWPDIYLVRARSIAWYRVAVCALKWSQRITFRVGYSWHYSSSLLMHYVILTTSEELMSTARRNGLLRARITNLLLLDIGQVIKEIYIYICKTVDLFHYSWKHWN
jgi:hypothetical protein